MLRVVDCSPVTHIVGPNLHRATTHVIQLNHIRGIRANRMAIHLNIRDILSPPEALTGNATHIPATRALQENEDKHTNEKNEGQHRRGHQDYKPCIVNYTTLDTCDVRNATVGYHQHFGGSLRLKRRDGRQRNSLSFGSDA